MRFSVASVLAFASVVLAQTSDEPTPGFNVITAPARGEKIPAGKSYPIVWAPDATHPGAITIKLYGGPAQNALDVVETVASGVDGADGTFPWVVASTLGDKKVYGFKIILESNTTVWQWGNPFEITGSKEGTSSSASASASASRSTSVSASSTASSTKVSATVTSTIVSESSKATSTFTKIPSSSVYGNSTVTHVTDSTVTTFTTGTASKGTATSSSTSSIATNGVAATGANGFALFGGVAMAVLAL